MPPDPELLALVVPALVVVAFDELEDDDALVACVPPAPDPDWHAALTDIAAVIKNTLTMGNRSRTMSHPTSAHWR